MGQVALGLRSLAFKLAIFVVMAALLAWALGGTLWPRAERIDGDRVTFAGTEWHLRMTVGGSGPSDGELRWHLMRTNDSRSEPVDEDAEWVDAAGLMVVDDALFVALRRADAAPGSGWLIRRIDAAGAEQVFPMPDRLAVEQQLARLRAGLDLQDRETISRQRRLVIDPIDEG